MFRVMISTIALLTSLVALSPVAVAQDEIEQIISRNPFDPDRGVKEEAEEAVPEAEPVEVVNEEHGMILDGTIMFSKSKMAIITVDKPPVATSSTGETRIRRVGIRRNRRTPLRGGNTGNFNAGAEDPADNKPKGPETHTVYVGDELDGYELMSVSASTAVLKKGNETIQLQLFSGEKENRGGSKEMRAVAKSDDEKDTRPRAQRIPGGDPNPKATEQKNSSDPPMKTPERKFERRERPKIKRSGGNNNFKM